MELEPVVAETDKWPMSKTLLSLGHGYSAQALARILPDDWRVIATTRSAEKASAMRTAGVEVRQWPGSDLSPDLEQATHVLSSIAPGQDGDPILASMSEQLRGARHLQWLGYLSTTGVYGDHSGGWVDETTALRPTTLRGQRRMEAEAAWAALGLPLHIFRLAGIYGPGRGPFAKVRNGTARRIIKKGQVFSRIHVEDIAQVLWASINNPGILLAKASEELREFVEHMGLPVAHSLMGKGALRDDHPLVMGMTGFWGTELVNQSCLKADYIFAVGTRFKEADCSSWYPGYTFNIPGSKVIHIDIEPQEIGRNYPTEIGVVADAKAALRVLTRVAKEMYPDGFPRTEKRAEIAEFRTTFKASNEEMQTSSAFPMMPERILADARKALPEDAIITTDVGWNKNGVGQQFDILTPGSILTPGGFATMGFGPPGAIGAKLAAPDRVVISLVGDGGFGQNPSMLATAVELNLGIIWLVMNNNAFGTIAGLQKAHYGLTYGTTFPGSAAAPANGPGYADIAKAYGAEGLRLSSADELLPALQAAIASGKPTVLDVPMINNPTPTTGHWNILDIYSPDKDVSHVAT